jgi:hypothetical protein
MSDERRAVSLEEALARIGDGEHIHTFRSSAIALIGADWERERLIEEIKKRGVEDSGPSATAMRHTLVMFDEAGPLFIEAAPAPEAQP